MDLSFLIFLDRFSGQFWMLMWKNGVFCVFQLFCSINSINCFKISNYIFFYILWSKIYWNLIKNQSFVNFEILTIFGDLITLTILSPCNVQHAFYTKVWIFSRIFFFDFDIFLSPRDPQAANNCKIWSI